MFHDGELNLIEKIQKPIWSHNWKQKSSLLRCILGIHTVISGCRQSHTLSDCGKSSGDTNLGGSELMIASTNGWARAGLARWRHEGSTCGSGTGLTLVCLCYCRLRTAHARRAAGPPLCARALYANGTDALETVILWEMLFLFLYADEIQATEIVRRGFKTSSLKKVFVHSKDWIIKCLPPCEIIVWK